jgi:23S rRNA (cytosine1962-C5)-methyltransferase
MATFRAVYGEGDFLPGLVVDKYGDYLAVQFLTCGMELRRELITGVLVELFAPKGIVARNDAAVRALEGLDERIEILHGNVPEQVEIEEHSLHFRVDLLHGQKTGHFLDQKENHLLLKERVKGKDILDCFCYSGSWGIHAASFGAARVTCVDISESAVALTRENAALNGFSDVVECEAADAFERLRALKSEGRSFDLVVLDPPAFVKSRKSLQEALKGYFTINRRAMELLKPGGYLITCSCSYHMEREMFRELLANVAQKARRSMRLIDVRSQAPDHPILLAVPETEYLKCYVLQAV